MSLRARIAAIDYALPAKALSNAELAQAYPSWRLELVAKRTGVFSRHIAQPHETALDLSEVACRKLFKRTGLDPRKVEGLLVCTQTPDYIMPPNSCLLQDRLKISKNAAAFDFTLACSGFIYGLFLADSLIKSGAMANLLLVTADTYSRLIHPGDRATRALFGDGAAATFIEAGQEGLGDFLLGSDGSGGNCFIVRAGGARNPRTPQTGSVSKNRSGNLRSPEHIEMDGPQVLAFVKREIPGCVKGLLRKAGKAPGDIDLIIPHQASQLALDFLAKSLGFPAEKFFFNLKHIGNTVSASIPIALRDAELAGVLVRGQTVLLIGFGVGLSWGACLVNWS